MEVLINQSERQQYAFFHRVLKMQTENFQILIFLSILCFYAVKLPSSDTGNKGTLRGVQAGDEDLVFGCVSSYRTQDLQRCQCETAF